MPLHNEINKVLVIGAGPSIVGEVSELDILAKQALTAFAESNVQVVLINPNPATVTTDPRANVNVYLEPMTLPFVKRIIRMEKPDAIIPAFGGKPALKLTKELLESGILTQMNIELLTINSLALSLSSPHNFYTFLKANKISVANQWLLEKEDDLKRVIEHAHFPLLLAKKQHYRPDNTISLENLKQLEQYFLDEENDDHFQWKDYRISEDLSNWEELIFDIIRDNNGNFCFVGNTGSLEPVGINSSDSLLVTPILTRNNNQIQRLRNCCRKIANCLNLHGALSIHFAVKQAGEDFNFKVLSVKPRLTQTSLLSYRSGVYSIGYVTAKVALGYNLNEITDPQSGISAAVDPIQDACFVKLPYWSFTEAGYNHYFLNNKTASGGQALGVGRNFESAFLKALQATTGFSNNIKTFEKECKKSEEQLLQDLSKPTELHLIILLAAIAKGISYHTLHKVLHVHLVFLQKFNHILILLKKLQNDELTADLLLKVKKNGFSNRLIAEVTHQDEKDISNLCKKWSIKPSYIEIDGTAGLIHPNIQAVYSSYGIEDEIKPLSNAKKCLLLGLKPFQVSLTDEFDYMLYHAAETLKEQGISPVIISNNPESISAAYNVCDRVYFEPITLENILDVANKENIKEIVTQFSGKQINEYRLQLLEHGLAILAQNNLNKILKEDHSNEVYQAGVKPVPALQCDNEDKIFDFVKQIGFPVLIGGSSNGKKQKSAVVFDLPALQRYIAENALEHISISKFIEGKKYEVTAISDGENVTIPGIIEHFEQTGSHASDSISVYRPQNLSTNDQRRLRDSAISIATNLHLKGPVNLHFLLANNQIYLLQIKSYSGHNVAFLTKALKRDITSISMQVLLGKKLSELELSSDIWPSNDLIHVKMPVLSYLSYQSENTFDSKMKTSGSVMGRAKHLPTALFKGYAGSDLMISTYGTVFISVKDSEKHNAIKIAARFHRLGFKLLATEGTANVLAEEGITTGIIGKVQEGSNSLLEKIRQHRINLVINVTSLSDSATHDAIMIKDAALSTHIPVFSSLQSAQDILAVLETLAMTTQPL
ncbi:carbamoyl phosphate synthase large subunit [Lactobacillus taiwanensis]|uniref:carbamoyl phosphate synthase large subunit n=1 Tax=Lactobacillus taiwanensis TaxID=508451 RepID=UPI002729A7CB|nr:carbamoyl phosphate synthase large subunit [Lactobacillus taiwanensis]